MNLQKEYKFIVFTDTHLPVENRKERFNYFLELLKKSVELTENIILLGDVFEVWSGVSYYNHRRGKALLEKIKELRTKAKFILIEGNWDFFLCKNFGEYFDFCTEKHLTLNENGKTISFTHGHYFGDWQTRVLNFILTNPISYFAWKTGCLKNLEIKVAHKFLNKETSPLPDGYDLSLAAKKLKQKFKDSNFIFCGHFHEEKVIDNVFFLKDYQSSSFFYGITPNRIDTLFFENEAIKKVKSISLK
ncbi:hypothetical protein TTHT_2244 [Thermotomaculum hydrothermale]|uniref:Calcineurin-like phosphoesterase domain-containing protein n=1 Tax=Thermotomaculum hydrothermale TaxID=981385 RepID=A0A7R6PP73_9BACT|nr:metallophosphoesterase [Thermotomaculum hydrothermale]BBB33667.1 hypothetical protein TTHT_2244 [Thermotomaculum hydrothermale]